MVLAAVFCAVLAACAQVLRELTGSPAAARVTATATLAALVLSVLSCAARGRRERGVRRVSWWLVTAGILLEGLARSAHIETGSHAWTGAAGLVVAGLLLLPGRPGRGWDLMYPIVDGLLLVTAVGWLLVAVGGDQPYAATALGATALFALSRAGEPGGPAARTLWPMVIGVLCAVGTESHPGAWQLVGWTVALAGLTAAAGQDVDRRDAPDGARLREAAAAVALVAPLGLVVTQLTVVLLAGGGLSATSSWWLLPPSALGVLRLGLTRLNALQLYRTFDEDVAARAMALAGREQLFRSLVANSSDVITVVDPHGLIRYQSDSMSRVFGHDAQALLGSPITALLKPGDARRVQLLLDEAVRRPRSTYTLDCPVRHAAGHWCDTETAITSLIDDPHIRGLVLNTRDVSERKQLEDELTRQAFHDGLTGLANRALFRDRVEHSLMERGRDHHPVAVLFLDLDGFKAVNDVQGHAIGDQLLGLVAERLQHCVRPGDTVARLGGDEFAVLVEGVDAEASAGWVADRIGAVLAQPFLLDGRELYVGVSCGIAIAGDGAETAELLLRNADLAMYRAKSAPDAGVVRFQPAMHDALQAQLEVQNDLRQALSRGQLALHYQPTVQLDTGRIVGVEALLRWYHPERGIVPPDKFISIAEDSGLIVAIGEWALAETCRQGARWQQWAAPGEVFGVAVNLSARQLTPALYDTVTVALADSGLPPAALVLEMTESVLIERTDEVVSLMSALKQLGVRFAIDDFGTGYSSLSYLHRFPVDLLKIDRSFVESVGSPKASGESAELVSTIVSLGRSLRLITVAEGIESGPQLRALLAMGCELGQGFLFSRPMPGAGIDELLSLRSGPPRQSWQGVDAVASGLGSFDPVAPAAMAG